MAVQLPFIFILFFANFLILFGPLLLLGAGQIKGYEPGDADWGVKLADVRGQAEAKEEITRVVSLWQSGEAFEKAGGKRERGVLFLGAPGTGKTMLSKGIATSFNCPFVSIPGSGFAQTFIGMDAVLVRYLAMKAKRLARKWGGQCIVFIDEIDAVGMRRQALGSGYQPFPPSIHDVQFYGPHGALTWDGDLVLESRAWRDRLFEARAEKPSSIYPPVVEKLAGRGQELHDARHDGRRRRARAQPAAGRDGRHRRPAADEAHPHQAHQHVPRRDVHRPAQDRQAEAAAAASEAATRRRSTSSAPATCRSRRSTRRSPARAAWAATSTSARRRGRTAATSSTSTWARSRTTPSSTSPSRRDELARITNGYSPAMIDQVCSMALTYAHSDGREFFDRADIVEAMTTVESGVAIGQPYPKHEERSIAVHEAGHAVCGHLFAENVMSTRLSIRKRGSSGGHHQAMHIEDRFVDWRSEEVAELIWVLGAMAAEYVFYGQNTTGVGGDIGSATNQACRMVGFSRDGAVADRPVRPDRRRGAPRGRGRARDEALREDRRAAHAPLRRRHDGRQPASPPRSATR